MVMRALSRSLSHSLSLSHTHTHTHTQTHTHTHLILILTVTILFSQVDEILAFINVLSNFVRGVKHTRTHTHTLELTHTHSNSTHTLELTHTHSTSHTHTRTHTHTLELTHTHTLILILTLTSQVDEMLAFINVLSNFVRGVNNYFASTLPHIKPDDKSCRDLVRMLFSLL
jgi:hypothetical protein